MNTISPTRKSTWPREGIYIDPLMSLARKSILNPYLTTTTWVALTFISGVYSLPPKEDPKTTSGQLISYVMSVVLYLAMIGSLLTINDVLNTGFLNNWTEDLSWDWNKEIVMITGGSGGIGASVAKSLIKRNPATTIIVVDHIPLTWEIASTVKVHYYQCDLSDSSAIKALCGLIKAEVGSPSVLINNAGLTRGRTIMEGDYSDVEITFRTNIIAPFLLAKEFLPSMVTKNHGHIVGVASMSAIVSPAGLADYAASKAGMLTMQETLRQELRFKHNSPCVRASSVVLAFVQTPMFKGNSNQPHFLSPLIHMDTVGEAIGDMLYKGQADTIWLPGMSRYLACLRGGPEWVLEAIRNSTRKLEVDYVGRQKLDPITGQLKQ